MERGDTSEKRVVFVSVIGVLSLKQIYADVHLWESDAVHLLVFADHNRLLELHMKVGSGCETVVVHLHLVPGECVWDRARCIVSSEIYVMIFVSDDRHESLSGFLTRDTSPVQAHVVRLVKVNDERMIFAMSSVLVVYHVTPV